MADLYIKLTAILCLLGKEEYMKHLYTIRWTYPNGKVDKVRLQLRNLDEAIKYVNSINSQTRMSAEILKERKVVYRYC